MKDLQNLRKMIVRVKNEKKSKGKGKGKKLDDEDKENQPSKAIDEPTEGCLPDGKKQARPDYMTGPAFLGWLINFQKSIVAENPNRKILLLLDNAACHTVVMHSNLHFPNINILPLPRNSTSVTQPLDAGIIAAFKARYRDMILQRIVEKSLLSPDPQDQPLLPTGKKKANPNKLSNTEGWHCIVAAWEGVKAQSIRNCFSRVPILCDVQKQELWNGDNLEPDVERAINSIEHDIDRDIRDFVDDEDGSGLTTDSHSEDSENNFKPPGFIGSMTKQNIAALSRYLDGSPWICRFLDDKRFDTEFMSHFDIKVTRHPTLYLEDSPLDESEEDIEDEDFFPSGSGSQASSDGSTPPTPEKMWKSTRKGGYVSRVRRLPRLNESCSDENSTSDIEEPLTQKCRKDIHNLLYNITELIPGNSPLKRKLQLIADSQVGEDVIDADSAYIQEYNDRKAREVAKKKRRQ